MTAHGGRFSHRELAACEHDGFVVVRGLLRGARLHRLHAWVDEVGPYSEVPRKYMTYDEDSVRESGTRLLSRLENIYPYHCGLAEPFDGERMRARVEQLFGEPAVLFKDNINFKRAGASGFAPHQDVQAGWDRYAGLHITAPVCVDAMSRANGCLELAAGHHRRSLIGDAWRPLAGDQLTGLDFAPYEREPGDAVFFDSCVPHRSGDNTTDDQRRVLYVTYNRRSEGDQREQYYADKRAGYPPDCEREPGREYVVRV